VLRCHSISDSDAVPHCLLLCVHSDVKGDHPIARITSERTPQSVVTALRPFVYIYLHNYRSVFKTVGTKAIRLFIFS